MKKQINSNVQDPIIQSDLIESTKLLKTLQKRNQDNHNSILLPSLAVITLASCSSSGSSNGMPVAATSSTLTMDEDTESNALNITAPTDPDMDALTIKIDSVPSGGSIRKANGDLVSSGDTLSVDELTGLTFTPNKDASSDLSSLGALSYTVQDGKGGTDNSTVSMTVNPLQDPPTIDSEGIVSVEENKNIVLSVSGNDVDGDTLTYSISGGNDSSLFQIDASTGELSFINKADFEAASDSNNDNQYEIEVTVDDGNGNTISQNLVVTVTDKDSSITLSNQIVDENSAGANIGTLTSYIDDTSATDTFNYNVSGTGSELFEVVEGELKLKADSSTDYETLSNYELTITATSETAQAAFNFTITVSDVNDSPTAINLSSLGVPEQIDGAVVGAISTADQDTGDTHTYIISDDRFEIVDGSLKLKAGNTVEYATEPSITITVTSTDSAGVEFTQDFSLVVGSIQLSSNEFAENSDGAVVGTLSITDPDFTSNVTYTLSGDDADFFELVDNQVKLKDGNSADLETKGTYSLTISASDDAGHSASLSYSINVTNVNEQPTSIALSSTVFDENSTATTIGDLSTADVDSGDTHTYDISGTDSASFEVVAGSLKLKDTLSANFESKSSYSIIVTSTDSAGLTTSKDFELSVNDVNDAPSALSVANLLVNENADGALLDGIVITDEDATAETYTYSISGDDADSFEVVDGQLKLKTGVSFDYETKASYSVTLTATDSASLSTSNDLTVTVNNLNDNTPEITSSSTFDLAENTSSVGTVTATDADGDSDLTYSISGGDDASSFTIDSSTGELTLQSKTNGITTTETSTDKTIIVTVAGNAPGQYYLDGVLFADYQFTVGATYTFDLSDSSNSNHPLRFSETVNGTFGGGSEYTTGVSYSGTAGQAGASTTITVTESTPELYYYCAVHSGMGGQGLLTSQASDNTLPVTLSNMVDNADGTYTVDIQVYPSAESFEALSGFTIWFASGSSDLTFDKDDIALTADGTLDQITTLSDGRVKVLWADTTNSLESGKIGTFTFNASSSSGDLPITIETKLTGGTKDGINASNSSVDTTTYNFTIVSADVDYENPTDTGADNVYNVTVQVSDGENSSTQDIVVTVTDDASYGPVATSITLPALDSDNSGIDLDNILPIITPGDGGIHISNLGIELEDIYNLIESQESIDLYSFEQVSEDINKNTIQGKYEEGSHHIISSNAEELEELVHFSEIG